MVQAQRAVIEAQRQSDSGRLRTAAPWLAAIVVSVLSYFGAQGAITGLGNRVEVVEDDVDALEVDIRTFRTELDMARSEVSDIAGISDRIEQSVEEATARGIRIGLAAVLKEYGIAPP